MPTLHEAPLGIALGANQPSAVGGPVQTLNAVRPLLEQQLEVWSRQPLHFRWSAWIETVPVGPADQPKYRNGVVLVDGIHAEATASAALDLLDQLQQLEAKFGRDRAQEQRWGPRPLDLDLLFWGEFRCDHPRLVLPHPRMHLRPFVLQPLLNAMQAEL